jgi:hypothetical protein
LPSYSRQKPNATRCENFSRWQNFYIADMTSNGIWVMPSNKFGEFTFIKTGMEAHGLYVT